MRYLLTADLQIQKGPRLLDVKRSLNFMRDYAIKEGIDNVMVLGDIYERNDIVAGSEEEDIFVEFISSLLMKNKSVYVLAGNHDIINEEQNVLGTLRKFSQGLCSKSLHVITEPFRRIVNGELPMLFIPYLTKGQIKESGMSYRQLMLHLIAGYAPKEPYILFTHCDITEAEPERGAYKRPDAISAKHDLAKIENLMWCFAGHVHKHQVMHNAMYCGSPVHTTFASGNDPKGFVDVWYDKGEIKWEFIQIPGRMQIELTFDMDDDEKEFVDQFCTTEDIPDSIVKLRLVYDYKKFDSDKASYIERALQENGAHYVMRTPMQKSASKLEEIEQDSYDDNIILEAYLNKILGIGKTDEYVELAQEYMSII